MTPTHLQALRRLFFLSTTEAAQIVGGVSERAWRHWEDGRRAVPADIEGTMLALAKWRAAAIKSASDAIAKAPAAAHASGPVLVWYCTLNDWITLPGREALHWRPHCSVVAHIAATFNGHIKLFDSPAYARWLGGRADGEMMRARWAAEITIDN